MNGGIVCTSAITSVIERLGTATGKRATTRHPGRLTILDQASALLIGATPLASSEGSLGALLATVVACGPRCHGNRFTALCLLTSGAKTVVAEIRFVVRAVQKDPAMV